MKEAVKANELKCNIEVEKKYDEWRAELDGVRERLRQAEMEKKTLEVDMSNRDKKIAEQEKKIFQLQEEAEMVEAKFNSRETELLVRGRNAFVASEEADTMFKGFTEKVITMGFTMACDHIVKNPDLNKGLPYDASINEEVINTL
ncbi:hypothetical protein ACH5RR_039400 [Cinchona calisaya]|uniref:Uncharacterized protein n=1 Tax=Cinchona calisaya TaxID=153742 RepID=A0ABD2XY41_9GENT